MPKKYAVCSLFSLAVIGTILVVLKNSEFFNVVADSYAVNEAENGGYAEVMSWKFTKEERGWKSAFIEIAGDFPVNQFQYNCYNTTRRGNWYDCNTYPYIIKKPCLIYSFGINYDFEFDDAMAEFGCEVHSFDPSMGNTKEHIRPSGVHFYPIGLGGNEENNFSPRMDHYARKNPNLKWKMRTLRQIMDNLGHQERYLDVLKIDVEGYEWDVLDNIIEDGLVPKIRQLNIEFHIFPDTPLSKIPSILRSYRRFRKAGFKRYTGSFYYFDMIGESSRRLQTEGGYVNPKFDSKKYLGR